MLLLRLLLLPPPLSQKKCALRRALKDNSVRRVAALDHTTTRVTIKDAHAVPTSVGSYLLPAGRRLITIAGCSIDSPVAAVGFDSSELHPFA